jgi:hypothetical protein
VLHAAQESALHKITDATLVAHQAQQSCFILHSAVQPSTTIQPTSSTCSSRPDELCNSYSFVQLCRNNSALHLNLCLFIFSMLLAAEEFALHKIIQIAQELCEDGCEEGVQETMEQQKLPRSTRDEDFDFVSDVAFQDHDVLMLFNMPQVRVGG